MTRSSTTTYQKVLVGLVAAAFSFGNGQAPAYAKAKATKTTAMASPSARPADNTMIEGTSFVDSVHEVVKGLNDYTFDCAIATYKKEDQPIREGGFFSWKKPAMLRVDVTKGGRKGCVLVKGPDGVIKGHLGGFLKGFVATLSADSGMIKSSNGYSMLEVDYLTLMNELKKQLAGPLSVRVTPQPVQVSSSAEKVFVFEAFKKNGDVEQITQRVHVDPQTKLPIEWQLYRNDGSLLSITYWTNIKINPGLDDSVFKIK